LGLSSVIGLERQIRGKSAGGNRDRTALRDRARYTPLSRHLPRPNQRASHVRVVYNDGQGVLRQLLAECTAHQWTILALATAAPRNPDDAGRLLSGDEGLGTPEAQVDLRLSGDQVERAPNVLAAVPGVRRIEQIAEDEVE